MIKLKYLNIDDRLEYHRIALGRKKAKGCRIECIDYYIDKCNTCDKNYKAVMLGIEDYIISRYKTYEDNIDKQDAIRPERILSPAKVKVLKGAYDSSVFNNTRSELMNNLPNEIKGMCPFCLIGEPSTLEHYLPKDIFPEYSIFTKNLIPCCSKCNGLKGTKYSNIDGTRRIINYYVDNINSISFLRVNLVIENDCGMPIIEYYICVDSGDRLSPIIKGHFEQLDLLRRYNDRAMGLLSSITDIMILQLDRKSIDEALDDSIELLKYRVHSLINQYGKNYWKACLCKFLVENRDIFKRIITNRIISENTV